MRGVRILRYVERNYGRPFRSLIDSTSENTRSGWRRTFSCARRRVGRIR